VRGILDEFTINEFPRSEYSAVHADVAGGTFLVVVLCYEFGSEYKRVSVLLDHRAESVAAAATTTTENIGLVGSFSDVGYVDESGLVAPLENEECLIEGHLARAAASRRCVGAY
jgi:hypothetical protein